VYICGSGPSASESRASYDFPTTSTTKLPGLMVRVGRFPGSLAGVSSYSAAGRKIFFVFGSNAIVFGARLGLDGLPHPRIWSADFWWEDAEASHPRSSEDEPGLWIKLRPIDTRADRKLVITLPDVGIHHNQQRLFAAADEQPFVLRVISETPSESSPRRWPALLDLERLQIERYHLRRVLAVT